MTPVLHREMRAHLEGCKGCATGLRDLEIALARLRGMAAAPAPAGLAAGVTAHLLASPSIATGPEPEPRWRPRRGERPPRDMERALPWPTLVAASLMIAAASFFAGHLTSGGRSATTVAALEDSQDQVRILESQLSDTRTTLDEENTALKHELMSLRSGLDEWKVEQASALEKERETRRGLDRRLEEATRRIEMQAESLATLQSRLEAAVEERDRAIAGKDEQARELQAARAELAEARRAASQTPARRAIARVPPLSRWREDRETPPVLFVREGEVLRLKTRGPFDEVGPLLFALAENDAEPEMADLALTTLETRLAPYAPAEEEEAGSAVRVPSAGDGLVGWFHRQVGIVNTAPEAAAERTGDRSARLDRLRRIWQQRFPATGS